MFLSYTSFSFLSSPIGHKFLNGKEFSKGKKQLLPLFLTGNSRKVCGGVRPFGNFFHPKGNTAAKPVDFKGKEVYDLDKQLNMRLIEEFFLFGSFLERSCQE